MRNHRCRFRLSRSLARLHFVNMYYRGRTEPVKHIAHIFAIVSHPFTWLQLRIIFKRNSKRAPQYTHTLQVSKRDKKNKVNLIWYNNNHNFIVRRLFLAATIFRPLWITMRFSVGFVLTTSIFSVRLLFYHMISSCNPIATIPMN